MADIELTAEEVQRASAEEQTLLNGNADVLKAQNDYLLQRVVVLKAAMNQLEAEVARLTELTAEQTDIGEGVTLAKDDEDDNPED